MFQFIDETDLQDKSGNDKQLKIRKNVQENTGVQH